jgi:hypothetical protein
LSEVKTQVEGALHRQVSHLFNRDVSLVFYDVTSACFEGTQCGKAKHGYSREHRPDLLQIEIGLMVDSEGMPIGHEVFDGNVKDVSTVLGALDPRCHWVSRFRSTITYWPSLSRKAFLVIRRLADYKPARRAYTERVWPKCGYTLHKFEMTEI